MSLGLAYDSRGNLKNLKTVFMDRLPSDHLYAVEFGTKRRPFLHNVHDWFSFLEASDEVCGRVLDKTGGGLSLEFPYISFHRGAFGEMMFKHLGGCKSFIDVGCGGGDKLAIVKENWPDVKVFGVEHDPAMAIWASLYADVVFCQDALKLDYNPYDMIYAYWPIAQTEGMDKLIQHILDSKHAGAKFVLVGYNGRVNKFSESDIITR